MVLEELARCQTWMRRATVGLRSQLKRLLSPLCPFSTSSLSRCFEPLLNITHTTCAEGTKKIPKLFKSTSVLRCPPRGADYSHPAPPLLTALPQGGLTNSPCRNPAWPVPGGGTRFEICGSIALLVLTFSLVTSTSSSVHGAPG